MTDLQSAERSDIRTEVDPFQGKKPTQTLPFNPARIIAETEGNTSDEKTYNPSNAAMFGMAVDEAIHNELSSVDKTILPRYTEYLEEKYGKTFVDKFLVDVKTSAQQVKEKLLPVIGNRIPFYLKRTPFGAPSKFQEQLYNGIKNPELHKIAQDMGYRTLNDLLLEASLNPHFTELQKGTQRTFDIRRQHSTPLPDQILNPELAELLFNASQLGHHIREQVDEKGNIKMQNYLKRHIAIPDIMAIMLDPHHPDFAELRKAAEQFIEGTNGQYYFGKKYLGDISSLDEETLKAGSLLLENAIVHRGKNMTWLPPVSILEAEGKTLVRPTFTALNLMDSEKVPDMQLITKYAEDFGETLNATRLTLFNIYDTGKNAPKDRDEDRLHRQQFEDGLFSFQNNYALALTSMVAFDSQGMLLRNREEPHSRVVHVPAEEARRIANQARAKVG